MLQRLELHAYGLEGLNRLASTGSAGVRIDNVNPGILDTPMLRRFFDDETAKPWAAFTPMHRLGKPEEVGDVAVWLCTEEARFVTGQSVLVDGGYTIAGMG